MAAPRFTTCVRRQLLVCGLVLLASGAWSATAQAAAGFVLTYDETQGDRTGQSSCSLVSGWARIESGLMDDVTLVDFARQTLWTLNARAKTATRLELPKVVEQVRSAMQGMQGQLAQAQDAMTQAMANTPPEQRAQLQQLMQQLGGGNPAKPAATHQTPTIESTGARATIRGYPCDVYRVVDAGTTRTEWRSREIPPAFRDPEYARLAQQFDRLTHWLRELQDLMASAVSLPSIDALMGTTGDARGFLVQMETTIRLPEQPPQPYRVTFLGLSKRDDLAASAFQIPAGFREVELTVPTAQGAKP